MDLARALSLVLRYHEESKHHVDRPAPSSQHLDWERRPAPFPSFSGRVRLPLPRSGKPPSRTFDRLYDASDCEKSSPASDLDTLGAVLYDSLALSARCQRPEIEPWLLRVNPSAGNLHPTEAYLIGSPLGLEEAGVYHYAPQDHALERCRVLPAEIWAELSQGLPGDAFLVALTSVHQRSAWRFGARAFRYAQLDLGHALGSLAHAAASHGLHHRWVETVSDDDLALLLGLSTEVPGDEKALCLVAIHPPEEGEVSVGMSGMSGISGEVRSWLEETPVEGRVLAEGEKRLPIPLLDDVILATAYDGGGQTFLETATQEEAVGFEDPFPDRHLDCRRLFRQRRSAEGLDARARLSAKEFFRFLARLATGPSPMGLFPWRPRVALLLFVHRVDGLEPGLYFLGRHPEHRSSLRESLRRDELLWKRPPGLLAAGCPEELDFLLLRTADCREVAEIASGHQPIAGDGFFSVALVAELEAPLRWHGPWFYPRLFWEAGLLGQVLYLEAAAAGYAGLGLGHFFDDLLLSVLGAEDRTWQTLYGFAVGQGIEDPRVTTGDPYA